MAVDQQGTKGLTVAGQAAAAATFISVPVGSIIESVTEGPGGSPDYEDQMDEDGKFHTRLTYEAGMNTATVVVVGIAYTKEAGDMDGSGSDYYVESVSAEKAKAAIRTTVTVTLLPTASA